MKTLKLLLCIAMLIPSISFAEGWNWGSWPWTDATNAPGLTTTGGSTSGNPDRTRVAGSAIILKTTGQIDDSTIPVVPEVVGEVPNNTITDVKPVTNPIEPAKVDAPKVDKQFIVTPK
jgi:hypothetical protein